MDVEDPKRRPRRRAQPDETWPVDPDASDPHPAAVAPTFTPPNEGRGRAAPDADLPVVPRSPYDKGQEVARGGLGRIVTAFDRRLGRTVALKELISRDPKAESRFVREAKITARLEHPNIVPIHEAGRWASGDRFYAMKLVDGRTLSEALAAADTREARLALLPHLIDVADAVAYAHTRGILHRDLKPANVMVGQFGETLVIDWGLAKDLAEDDDEEEPRDPPTPPRTVTETSDGIVVGTPPYMPPEQARAERLDERSDVYALGAMLYQILTGRRPYEEVAPRRVLLAVVEGPPAPIERLAPDMPADLVAIVKKAMHRLPELRYPSAREMAEELRRFTTGQLVAAHDYSPLERTRRFVRRHSGAVTVAATSLVVLVAFGVWSFRSLASRADEARAAMQVAEQRVRELRLEKARSLLPRDPTMAAAELKRVRPPIRGVASVAAEAADAGVASVVLDGHVQEVDLVRAHPEGRGFASGSRDGWVRLHDADGRVLQAFDHGARVGALGFSPSGRLLASGAYDGRVRLFDLRRPRSAPRVIDAHEGPVVAVVFGPTGDRLVSVGRDDTLALWTLDGQEALRRPTPPVEDPPEVRFLGEGRYVVTALHGPEILRWDLVSGAGRTLVTFASEVTALDVHAGLLGVGLHDGRVAVLPSEGGAVTSVSAHPDEVRAVRFSPDGRRLASGGMTGDVQLVSVDGRQASRVLEGHRERVTQIRFSVDGRWLASSSWDGTVRAWELHTDEVRALRGHAQVVTDLVFLGDRNRLVSSSWDTTLRIWPLGSTGERLYRGHRVGVHAVAFSPDDTWLASGGHDHEVRLWRRRDGAARVLHGHEDHVYRVRFSPDGRWLASSSDDRTVRLWATRGPGARVLEGHAGDVEELAFSGDGAWLASAGRAGDVFVWGIEDPEARRSVTGHEGPVVGLGFVAGGRLATAGRDGQVLLSSPDGVGPPRALLIGQAGLRGLAVDPEGARLAVTGGGGRLWVWSMPSGDLLYGNDDLVEPEVVQVSPDRRFVAVASAQEGLWLCNLAYEICDELRGHEARVFALAFSPDGRTLVSGSGDHSVRLWDVDTLESRVLRGHRAPVFDVSVSSAGDRVASASGDGDVREWPLQRPPRPDDLPRFLDALTTVEVSP